MLPRREAPAPGRIRRQAPARLRPDRRRTRRGGRNIPAPRLALRLQAPRLDRIVRGRAWIPVLGVLLVAIVGLRVEVLKLGSSVGTEIQQATTLQSSNSALRAQISALSDNRRIANLAEQYGMHMPNPLDVHFVQATVGTHVAAAIRNISSPASSTFLTGLASEQQASQQSTQAVAAMNGAATPATSTATGSGSTSAGSTSIVGSAGTAGPTSAVGATSSGTGASSGAPAGTTGGQTTLGATSSAGGSTSSTSGTTPPSSTGPSSGGTTGGTTGLATSSPPSASQTPSSTGSTNGGTGLAG